MSSTSDTPSPVIVEHVFDRVFEHVYHRAMSPEAAPGVRHSLPVVLAAADRDDDARHSASAGYREDIHGNDHRAS